MSLTVKDFVAGASLLLGTISFPLYALATGVSIWSAFKSSTPKETFVAGVSAEDALKVLNSVATVLDSLGKLSPTLVSLLASLVFYAIAAACGVTYFN